jgi:hypothetical protein
LIDDLHLDFRRTGRIRQALKASLTTPQAQREVRHRARVTVDTLRQLVEAATPIEGPTAVPCFSHGYATGAMDLSAVVEQAARARVAVYPLDPRPHLRELNDPFVLATRGSLRELANATGGTWQDDGETLGDYLLRVGAAVGR